MADMHKVAALLKSDPQFRLELAAALRKALGEFREDGFEPLLKPSYGEFQQMMAPWGWVPLPGKGAGEHPWELQGTGHKHTLSSNGWEHGDLALGRLSFRTKQVALDIMPHPRLGHVIVPYKVSSVGPRADIHRRLAEHYVARGMHNHLTGKPVKMEDFGFSSGTKEATPPPPEPWLPPTISGTMDINSLQPTIDGIDPQDSVRTIDRLVSKLGHYKKLPAINVLYDPDTQTGHVDDLQSHQILHWAKANGHIQVPVQHI